MSNDSIQLMIERYKKELIEYERKRPKLKAEAEPESPKKVKSSTKAENQNAMPESAKESTDKSISADTEESKITNEGKNEAGSSNINITANVNNGVIRNENPKSSTSAAIGKDDANASAGTDTSAAAVSVNASLPPPLNESEDEYNDAGINFPPYINKSENEYASYDELIASNPKTGYLRVQVYVGDALLPVPNARVIVVRKIGNDNYTFYDEQTDSSGIVYGLTLPCPDKNLTNYPTALLPYETYSVWVEHPNYFKAFFADVFIFDGIETTQNVALIPESAVTDKDIVKIYSIGGPFNYDIN